MKISTIYALLFLASPGLAIHAIAQPSAHAPANYKAWVTLAGGERVTGMIAGVTDSTIVLKGLTEFSLSSRQIQVIRIRKATTMKRGIRAGLITGMVAGGIVGALSHDSQPRAGFGFYPPTPAGVDIGFGMAAGALIGVSIGGLAGSHSRSFTINGKQSDFQLFVNRLTAANLN